MGSRSSVKGVNGGRVLVEWVGLMDGHHWDPVYTGYARYRFLPLIIIGLLRPSTCKTSHNFLALRSEMFSHRSDTKDKANNASEICRPDRCIVS